MDTCEMQARTWQELEDPELEVVEVFDTAVVLRMTRLTGDHFELTVYAPGGASENLGAAATLMQRGPVRSSDSVHRMGQLESSQVYVTWVRVFCDGQTRESKQKGFKTLEARVKTIWDEADHVILGVQEAATAKEVTRAWRHKSLQYHPDKETDPEKKDAAEEMMKRLNLAKQNMLRGAPGDCTPSTASATPSSPAEPGTTTTPSGQDFFGHCHRQERSSSTDSARSSGDGSDGLWEDGEASVRGSFSSSGAQEGDAWGRAARRRTRTDSSAPESDAPATEAGDSLRCSLRIYAPTAPRLRVVDRGLTFLRLEATGLLVGCLAEVQRFADGCWLRVAVPTRATSQSLCFSVEDLDENSSYRFRLRTTVELEPLRLLFAQFAVEPLEPGQGAEPGSCGKGAEDVAATGGVGIGNGADKAQHGAAGLAACRPERLEPVLEREGAEDEAEEAEDEAGKGDEAEEDGGLND